MGDIKRGEITLYCLYGRGRKSPNDIPGFSDGTIYRYVRVSAAVNVGVVLARDVSLVDQASIVGRLSTATSVTGAAADLTTYPVGATEIFIQDSTVFASDTDLVNSRAGGYLGISNEGGEGGRYRIKALCLVD